MRCFRRPLVPCLLVYIFGLWYGRELFLPGWIAAAAILIGAAAAAIWWTFRRGDMTALLLAIIAAIGIGRSWVHHVEQGEAGAILSELIPQALYTIEGRVKAADSPPDLDLTHVVLTDARITSGATVTTLPGFVAVQVTGSEMNAQRLVPGTLLQCVGSVSPVGGLANFYTYDRRQDSANKRIYTTVRVGSPKLVEIRNGNGIRAQTHLWLAGVRAYVSDIVMRNMPAREARLTISMLFNDRGMLGEDERAFRDSGTIHLFAVSGMHVAIFALILNVLLRAFRVPPSPRWVTIVAVLFLYIVLLDFIAPAYRAFLMLVAYASSRWLRREPDGINSVAFGAFVILLLDPLSLWQPGFLLSMSGVTGLVVLEPILRQWISAGDARHRGAIAVATDWLLTGIRVSIAITLMILPMQFFYFQQFNLLSPFANLFAAAMSTPLLASALVTAAVGWSDQLASSAGAATFFLMRVLTMIAHVTSAQEWAIWRVPKLSPAAVLAWYAVIASGYYMVRADSPEFRLKSRARLVIATAGALVILLGCVLILPGRGKLRIWFLDVGQGDATFVQFPSGQNLLVDAGNIRPDAARLVIEPHVRALGIDRIHNLLATHADIDHTGGFAYLMQNVRVDAIQCAPGFETSEIGRELLQLAAGKRIPVSTLAAGISTDLGDGTTIHVLSPDGQTSGTSDNQRSIVLQISRGTFDALLMGDMEGEAEQALVEKLGPCDVLKVGHHGSRNGTGADLLRNVAPSLGVISCGARNRYRHPAPEVLQRLEARGVATLRTDCDGAVLVETDGFGFTVRTARP